MKWKTETQVIRQMFEGYTTHGEIEKILFEVRIFKDGNGLHRDVGELGPDLYRLSIRIQEKTGLGKGPAGTLASQLWFMEKAKTERGKRLPLGITHATLISDEFLCPYEEHRALAGKKFSIKSGVRLGWFRKIHPGELFGCGCSSRPILPF